MHAEVIRLPNPFDPAHRETAVIRRPLRVRRLVPRDRPTLVMLNGRPLMRAGWRRRLRDGDQLAVISLPRGGGGSRGGSNPLRLILSLALMAFAPWAAGQLLGVAGTSAGLASTATLFGSFTMGQATALGIYMAGNALINAVLPGQRASAMPTPSPTYSLQAQGNAARLDAAIPVQYGRLKVFPDFAAQPYAEFAGNEQYLYQLLCLGAGTFEIEQLLVEDTPIDSFSEIELQVVNPGETPTLFPTAVVTSVEVSGQDLPGMTTGTWSQSGTTVTVTEVDHGRAIGHAVHLVTTRTAAYSIPVMGAAATIDETAHGRTVGQSIHLTFSNNADLTGTYTIASVPGADSYTVTLTAPPLLGGSGTVTFADFSGQFPIATVPTADTFTVTLRCP